MWKLFSTLKYLSQMNKKLLTALLLFSGCFTLIAQDNKDDKPDASTFQFLPVYDSYASKECKVKLKDGTVITGIKDDLDRKKGQIYSIEIKDVATGKKKEYEADQIDEMYLIPSNLNKFTTKTAAMSDMRSYTNKNLDKILDQGYVFFKNQSVSLKNKKKEKEYLMQLVNPEFCSVIQVFGDNMAGETASIGFGPLKMAGGIDKSFYVKKGEEIFWLKKSDFEEGYDKLFADSPEFVAKYPKKDVVWRKLNLYIYEYTKLMNKE